MSSTALNGGGGGGVNSNKGCLGERKKFFTGNLKILPRIGRLEKFTGRHKVIKLNKFSGSLRFFWEYLPKFQDNTWDFWEDFYVQVVLLEQHLLKLSTPVL